MHAISGSMDDLLNRGENSGLEKLPSFFPDNNEGYWTSDLHSPVKLRLKQTKGAGLDPPFTVIEMLERTLHGHATKKALCVKRVGIWKTWTYQKYYNESRALAQTFIKVGLPIYSTVCNLIC